MEEMSLHKLIDFIVKVKPIAALLEMMCPIKTCVLNIWRKTFIHWDFLYIVHMCSRSDNSTYISFEKGSHKPDTALSQLVMRLLHVHPEV